jgi:hypothetical protein
MEKRTYEKSEKQKDDIKIQEELYNDYLKKKKLCKNFLYKGKCFICNNNNENHKKKHNYKSLLKCWCLISSINNAKFNYMHKNELHDIIALERGNALLCFLNTYDFETVIYCKDKQKYNLNCKFPYTNLCEEFVKYGECNCNNTDNEYGNKHNPNKRYKLLYNIVLDRNKKICADIEKIKESMYSQQAEAIKLLNLL